LQSEVSALQASLGASQASLSSVVATAAATQAGAATKEYVDQSLATKASQADVSALAQTVQMSSAALSAKAAASDLSMAQQSLGAQISSGLAAARAEASAAVASLSAVVSGKASQDHVDELHSQQAADMASLEAALAQKADADNVFTQAAAVDMVESKLSNIYTKDAVDLKLAPLASTASVTQLHDSVVTALQSKASEQELSQAVSLLQAQITQIPINTGSGSSAPVDISGKADISAVYLKGQVDTLLQTKASVTDLAVAVAPLARQDAVTTQIAAAVASAGGGGASSPVIWCSEMMIAYNGNIPANGWPNQVNFKDPSSSTEQQQGWLNLGQFSYDDNSRVTVPSDGLYSIEGWLNTTHADSYSLFGVKIEHGPEGTLVKTYNNQDGCWASLKIFRQLSQGAVVSLIVGTCSYAGARLVIQKIA